MGIEIHITRGEWGADSSEGYISSKEWMDIVTSDPELEIYPDRGEFYVEWKGKSEYEDPWLEWFDGNISTKMPDTALYKKMLEIAKALNAKVVDDNGTEYPEEAQWEYNPNDVQEYIVPMKKPWWKFW